MIQQSVNIVSTENNVLGMVSNMRSGKGWEKNLQDSLGEGLVRLYDTTSGYAGVKNPCDFIYYNYPYQAMIEAKTTKGKRLSFLDITTNQWKELNKYNKLFGVCGVIAVEFSDYKKGFLIRIDILQDLKDKGYKSISIEYCEQCEDIYDLELQYKVTNCSLQKEHFNYIISIISNR